MFGTNVYLSIPIIFRDYVLGQLYAFGLDCPPDNQEYGLSIFKQANPRFGCVKNR